ncbi:Fe-S oxidoreductase [Beggiatoa alba B18LD]|uniref:Fe-S oxidoreductase n=1 Tax=Beggiatoa alba B18LD TaxID=395493 RepID=I3CJ32_9GAMM|nr:heterodisulfide reductase-related iron-sulfur binding cluster [Beggiatoa alba]EIJ43625.1 Fe-S oxidoreductase [Beggiatoa alba B18LD]
MSADSKREGKKEGSLEAPTRHPLDWKNPDFYNEQSLFSELERVFDICHGCRRCFKLCHSFPTLFDLIDASESLELDGVAKADYWKVVDHCYLCDMCYMTMCPYVPPHEWNIDFPHLMLRAKAVKFKKGDVTLRDKLLTSTDLVGSLAGIPVVAGIVNTVNSIKPLRKVAEKVAGIHADAILPKFHSDNLRKRDKQLHQAGLSATPTANTRGKVALFVTCYGNRNAPDMDEALIKVFEHNGIPVKITEKERCCGMPKMELGDLEAVKASRDFNIPILSKLIDDGYDIVTPIPSCTLMFKQELPLMFPDDAEVQKVKNAMYDPFEYLMLRHKDGALKTDFQQALGKVSYHVPCHLRVQNIGLKTRDLLELIPNTTVETIERCSGHDGTYAVKAETHAISMKIGKPVVKQVANAKPDYFSSDCPMAGDQIHNGLQTAQEPTHPMILVRKAYGI